MRKASTIVVTILIAGMLLFTLMDRNEFDSTSKNLLSSNKTDTIITAPVLQLKDWQGNVRTIGGKTSSWTLVNFWASWCGPCEEESADLVKLYKHYGDQIEIIGINAAHVDNEAKARAFVLKHDLKFTIVFDVTGQATESYQVVGYPSTYLVNPNGQVVATMAGLRTYAQFREVIDKHMK
jgi:thiol-disulfide isomerase/thioredoxin